MIVMGRNTEAMLGKSPLVAGTSAQNCTPSRVSGKGVVDAAATLLVSAQFVQQRLCFLQVFGIEPFGEPAVDLGQHRVSFVFLALLLP
jgi:hypothetical protein